MIDEQIAEACELSVRTVESVRQRFVEQGFRAALERQKQIRPSRQKLLDGEKEAHLVAVCCGARPGRARAMDVAAAGGSPRETGNRGVHFA